VRAAVHGLQLRSSCVPSCYLPVMVGKMGVSLLRLEIDYKINPVLVGSMCGTAGPFAAARPAPTILFGLGQHLV